MAMMECPECRKQMSGIAEACPFCGYPHMAVLRAAAHERWKARNQREGGLGCIAAASGYAVCAVVFFAADDLPAKDLCVCVGALAACATIIGLCYFVRSLWRGFNL